ncbi:S-layer homology domain-containing protein [Alkalinema pantanalense CENA528]|uniref:S-layer homology domain-containing protein n=1 Tax=Alkalinema pantanalense TaxID=1620705 RepID=UPI003D6DC4CF
MVKGKISKRSGNVKLIEGTKITNKDVNPGDILRTNRKLNVEGGSSASLYFFGNNDRNTKFKVTLSGKGKRSKYTFPCTVSSGLAITSWDNGRTSGCQSLVVRIQNDSTGKLLASPADSSVAEAAVPLASPKPASAQDLAIQDLVARKVMTGYPDGDPRPNEFVTRAQFASLVSAANLYWKRPLSAPDRQFNDVASHWAKDAIARAAQLGFLSGYRDGSFRPEERIPRQQAISALVSGLGLAIPSDPQSVLSRYQDANQIAPWAQSNVAAAVQARLMIDSTAHLQPQKPATRGETAVLIAQSFNLRSASDDVFGQPDPDPDEPAYRGPEVRISPQTDEVTLVQVDASETSGTIEVNSLTGLVKVTAQASPNAAPTIAYLRAGERFRYEIREEIQSDKKKVSRYEGFKTVIEQDDRRSIIESPDMQSFLDDWVPEAEALPRAEYEKLFNNFLFRTTPLTQPGLNAVIVQAMKDLGTFSTLPFIAPTNPPGKPGENSCGWAVNQVLAQARIESLDTYVPRVKKLLESGRGTKIDPRQAQAGDIVIAPPNKLPNGTFEPDSEPHMGICTSPTTVRSASSSTNNNPRRFVWDTNLNFDGYFGTTPSTIYRLNS